MNFRFLRRFFYEIHLWLGILSGVILFIVCLSGSIYTFRDEIQYAVQPGKYRVPIPEYGQPAEIDTLLSKLETEYPNQKVVNLVIPDRPGRTVLAMLSEDRSLSGEGIKGTKGRETVRGQNPGKAGRQGRNGHGHGHGGGRTVLYVNPYTLETVGEGGSSADSFFMSVMRLHRFLWLPVQIGRPVVGIATLIFVVLVVSGFVLWLPRKLQHFGNWKMWAPGLKIRFRKGIKPLLYDLHNTVGFYAMIPLLILALTGLCWSFAWYRDAAGFMLGDTIFKQRMQRPEYVEPPTDSTDSTNSNDSNDSNNANNTNNTKPLRIGEILARQEKLTPGPGELVIAIPQERDAAVVVQKGRTGFFTLSHKDKTQWDRFRGVPIPVEHYGRTVVVERFSDKPWGAKIAASVRSLHFGDITGLSSKIVFFLACVVATSFPITGTILWIEKLRLRRRKTPQGKSVISPSTPA